MGYLVCEKCGGYYELKEGEAIDDFEGCECGGKFRYVKSLNDINTSKNQQLNPKNKIFCTKCGAENLREVKFCGTCGKPIKNNQYESFSKNGLKISDKLQKYKNKRTCGFLSIAIIGIILISFLATWLPAIVFADHYDDGFMSFDYPNNLEVTNGTYDSNEVFTINDLIEENKEDNSSGYGTVCTLQRDHDSPFEVGEGLYEIHITFSPVNLREYVPTNTTVNKTVGFNSDGSEIIAPVNVNNGTQSVSVNQIQKTLDYYRSDYGEPKKTTKTDYTYYELDTEKSESGYFTKSDSMTIIEKKDFKYYFIVSLNIQEQSKGEIDSEAYSAYHQIVNSFKIG